MAAAMRIASFLLAALATLGCTCRSAAPSNELTVLAASSMTEAFAELGEAFEASHPGTAVRPVFAGSQALRLQLEQGAPADVFASANAAHVEALVDRALLENVQPFASNQLAIVVSNAARDSVTSLEDLATVDRIVIGTPNVPIGAYTQRFFDQVGSKRSPALAATLRERVVSEENNVRLVRAKVELGEADAAIVYLTDAMNAKRGVMVRIPDELNVEAQYYVGRVAGAQQSELADDWIVFLSSEEAQGILRRHGFRVD